MDYLIDTNVISETVKRQPNAGVVDFLRGREFLLPCIVFAELNYGAYRLADAHGERQKYIAFIENLRNRYREVIVPVSLEIAEISGRLRAFEERRGRALSGADAIIAATAMQTGTTLVTRNVRDFAELNIPLFNPFSPG